MTSEILFRDIQEIEQNLGVMIEELKGTTLLLTGAYGMIASYIVYLCAYLNNYKSYGIKLIVIVRSREKFLKKFVGVNLGFVEILENNLSSNVEYDGDIDYIIHAASLASPQHYAVRPIEVFMPNVFGTKFLLDLAVKKNIRSFLLFSTGDVYGFPPQKEFIDESDYGVMDPLDIHSCYSESKRMAETICKSYLQQKNVPVKIARIWHTYAPSMDIENDPRVFASFVKNIVNNEDIVMYSDGSSKRCFTYITDAIAGYLTIMLKGKNGEAYNVCNTSQVLRMDELANILVNIKPELNLKVVKKQRDSGESYTENNLAPKLYPTPCNNKLQSLGWKPYVEVSNGFERVIDYLYNRQS